MYRLEVSAAVRHIYMSLGFKSEAEWDAESIWTGAENFSPHRGSIPRGGP